MGGRGSWSYSGQTSQAPGKPLGAYAVATLNKGVAKGTTTESAISRFRDQLMDAKVEYSAFIDDLGYVHALGSTGDEGSTQVAPLTAVWNEKGVSTVIHNHPHGTSDGRKWGGPFSEGDMSYIANAHFLSGGKVNRMAAMSNEGTYSAIVRKSVS